jgi:CDP-glucose 4,6-dehydratase
MQNLFNSTFNNLTILLTGHTGFKGSWLTLWLKEMGANVVGFSLPEPPTIPSNYELIKIGRHITDMRGDIRDYDLLRNVIEEYQPHLVIHFAAQTTVLPSYRDPKLSLDTNVGGTVNVLEAVRTAGSVKALVICATDKVYENRESAAGYVETPMTTALPESCGAASVSTVSPHTSRIRPSGLPARTRSPGLTRASKKPPRALVTMR